MRDSLSEYESLFCLKQKKQSPSHRGGITNVCRSALCFISCNKPLFHLPRVNEFLSGIKGWCQSFIPTIPSSWLNGVGIAEADYADYDPVWSPSYKTEQTVLQGWGSVKPGHWFKRHPMKTKLILTRKKTQPFGNCRVTLTFIHWTFIIRYLT